MKKSISFLSLSAMIAFSALSAKAPETPVAKSADKAPVATKAKEAPATKTTNKPAAPTAEKTGQPVKETPAAKAADPAPVASTEAPAAKTAELTAEQPAKETVATKVAESAPTAVTENPKADAGVAQSTKPSEPALVATAETAPETVAAMTFDITKVSEAFGHLISKSIDTVGVKFDIAQVIKGLEDAVAGKTSPMSEAECLQAIAAVQETVFKQQCAENLKRAETFLSDNGKTTGVVALEEGKVQYKITEQGKGVPVESHFSPLIKYCGKYLDGSVFGSSKEEETISLDEIIPGLKAGLLGMKEGEKRTVYIHPDLAYGATSGYLPPNSLLTFEVEIVKANAPIVKETAEDTSAIPAQPEIAEIKTDVR